MLILIDQVIIIWLVLLNVLCFWGFDSTMLDDVQEEFKEYAEKAKFLPPTTKDSDKLAMYGLYKQATTGTINTSELDNNEKITLYFP